jgi:lysine-N-methylase
MTLPIRHLPVLQNWDCHVCGSCCKEYKVGITDKERKRIESQDWSEDQVVNGAALFRREGPPWNRSYRLNHRADGSCVFLSSEGRCRIHERFGYETKPLACRMFPFVLVPAGDHWRVGIRYACPSAADNKGRAVGDHEDSLRKLASELARREGLEDRPDARRLALPRLQRGQRVDWPDVFRFVKALLTLLHERKDPMERRWRKCLAFADQCRQARFDAVSGSRLAEFLEVIAGGLENDVPVDPALVAPPTWVGRMLFRQAVAVFTRKDYGPNRGLTRQGRTALFGAAWRFGLGRGSVPRLHNLVPETTFEAIEQASGKLMAPAEEMLERYYTTKVDSLQFFGATNFRLPFWEGLEMLALTLPIILWVTRSLSGLPQLEAVSRALTIVDDHFGFNPALSTRRHRVNISLLARTGELTRLTAWYGR